MYFVFINEFINLCYSFYALRFFLDYTISETVTLF